MTRYSVENFERFQQSGVKSEDIKAMKIETVEDAFGDTREDFDRLAEQLADGIKEGRWTAILGDDVSGRLPTLVIDKIATRYAQEHEMKTPERIFFSGGSVPYEDISEDRESVNITEEQEQKLKEYIHQQSARLGGRVLIVTEHINTGSTLRRIARALHEEGIDFDIASLWSTRQTPTNGSMTDRGDDPEIFREVRFYNGKANAGASGPFGSEVSGLLYNLGTPLNEATGIKKTGTEPVGRLNEEADRDLVKLARQKVNELVDSLYSKYFEG